MANSKNPTALWFDRMARASQGGGTLAALMQKFFRDNYGQTSLPKTVADYSIYDQQIVNPGLTPLFQGQFTPERSNWPNGNNFIAAESEHMVVQSIRAYQGTRDTLLDEIDWQPGISDEVLKNGVFDATINGQRVLTGIPLTVFDNNALSTSEAGLTDENRGTYFLMEPLVVLGQTGIQINVRLNPGKTIPTGLAIRLELEGQRFIGN